MCSETSKAADIQSQVEPGRKVQEQFLHKKKTLSWVVAQLPSIASIKVWKRDLVLDL